MGRPAAAGQGNIVVMAGDDRSFGMGRGKVFPAGRARSLVNPMRRLVQSPRRTIAAMELAGSERVLEVGSGPGFFSTELLRAVSRGQLVVMDLQPEMLVMARDRLGATGRHAFTQADAARLPFATAAFDAVFVATMLGEVPDQDGSVAEIRRVLRRAGILTVAETRRDSDFIRLSTLRSLIEPHGLAFIRRRGIRWQYVATFQAL